MCGDVSRRCAGPYILLYGLEMERKVQQSTTEVADSDKVKMGPGPMSFSQHFACHKNVLGEAYKKAEHR